MEKLANKLQNLCRGLQSWSQSKVGSVNTQLAQATELLHRLEIARDLRRLSTQEEWLRRTLKQHCLALASFQRTIARIRSRIDWLSDGDANTSFFHAHAKYRRRKNYIAKIQVDDTLLFQQHEKEDAVWNFYNNLIGTSVGRSETLNLGPSISQHKTYHPWTRQYQRRKYGTL